MRSDFPLKLALGLGLAAAFAVLLFSSSVIFLALSLVVGSALGFAVAELVQDWTRRQDW
jgi:hypothetical protein